AAVSYALFEAARGPLIADGVELCEQSWILEQNQGMRAMLESIGMQVAQRFRIYQKPLPA
ncbi:MAG: N-acetyltransferase, partial [Wenzhouxiangellaceae bacterium]